MLLGIIADDYTGASDIANTLAKGGLATTQFLGLPTKKAPLACEAGVVALKSRSIAADAAVTQSLAALAWLQAQGCTQFVFKYCSTFDSTPAGNIGPVGEALAKALDVRGVPACPAFPTTGRTVYQGHLFVGDRLLNESGLETHPLNPMTDADLRRWLTRQSKQKVGLVPWSVVRQGAATLRAALDDAAAKGECLVIVDAVVDDDLRVMGEACADRKLLTGGSGIAIGLPANFIKRGLAKGSANLFRGAEGPGAILSGSCSKATLGQIEVYRRDHPTMPIDVDAVMTGSVTAPQLANFIRDNSGQEPLVFSSAAPERVKALQAKYGMESVAHRLDGLFAETAKLAVAGGVGRLVVAGGETSGAVMGALDIDAVSIGPEIDPGVPALATLTAPPLALALKSGNFGGTDFFAKALRTLGRQA